MKTRKPGAITYAAPKVLATYSARQLVEDAAACQYESDAGLKDEIDVIRKPISGLSRIDTIR